jgi:hypothetical protein
VRVAEGKDHGLALEFGAIADAHDIQVLLEAFGDARERRWPPAPAPARAGRDARRIAQGVEHAVLLLEADAPRQWNIQLALGTLHVDGAAAI